MTTRAYYSNEESLRVFTKGLFIECTAKIFRSRKVELIHLISRAKETFYEEDVRNIRQQQT